MENNAINIQNVINYYADIERNSAKGGKILGLRSKIDYVLEFESSVSDVNASEFIIETVSVSYLTKLKKKHPDAYQLLEKIVDNAHVHRYDTTHRIYGLLKYIRL